MSLLGKSNGGPTVGIDIGSNLIKVVEAKPGKDGIQVTALGVAPTPQGAIENEVIVDPQSLGLAIRQLLSECGISSKRSVSSVSGQSSVVVRIIEVPMVTKQLDDKARKELAETMKWEVERHVPFSAAESIMDYQPIERMDGADDQNLEVLLAVARQEVINSHVDTLMAAKLDPVAVEVEAVATCRSVLDLENPAERTVAVLNIGAAATELAVYRDSLLSLARTLPLAGDTLTRSISDTFGLSVEDAEKVKKKQAVVMMERLSALSGSMGPGMGFDDGDSTMDLSGMGMQTLGGVLSGPSEPEEDFGFIPGLGFSAPSQPAAPAAAPDFDIDMPGASGPAGGFPTMNFDMDLDSGSGVAGPSFDMSDGTGAGGGSMHGPVNTADITSEQIFDAMAPVLMDLVTEIRRSLEYYSTKYQSHPEKIVLCGGTARMRNLDQMLQSELGVPVSLANPLKNVTVLSNSLSQDYLEDVAAIVPVSLGLAVRDMIGG